MKDVSVVIGSNFGDEGKGLTTDYLAATGRASAVIVRFNGGAQAGHTVNYSDGTRHVYHHFGSGTLIGMETFLSRFFILDPVYFSMEFKRLRGLTSPKVTVDPRCRLSTPFDMMLNQAAEFQRGDGKHGSCGWGINETVRRNEDIEFATPLGLMWMGGMKSRLEHIRDNYVPKRMAELNLKEDNPHLYQLKDPRAIELWLKYFDSMMAAVKVVTWETFVETKDRIIFEGAQGLRLDEDSPEFPHVTRSKTGLFNVHLLMKNAGLESNLLKVYFVSRTYITRHGAGPLKHELHQLPYRNIRDSTNIPNQFQGSLRFSYLDVEEMMLFINGQNPRSSSIIRPNMVFTCADQLDNGKVVIHKGDKLDAISIPDLAQEVIKTYGMEDCLVSYGNSRHHIKQWSK